jgi:hemerythrin-like domain-containing protein
MKKYIITANLNRYIDNYEIFEGESLEDPQMRKEIMEWLTRFDDGNFDFDDWCRDGLNQKIDSSMGIKAYEISEGPMLVPDIWKDLRKHLDEIEAEVQKRRDAVDKENRRERYEQLKKEFENE